MSGSKKDPKSVSAFYMQIDHFFLEPYFIVHLPQQSEPELGFVLISHVSVCVHSISFVLELY